MAYKQKEDRVIARLRDELEQHLGWGKGGQWHSSMFQELSDKVFEKCHVMISVSTLKRFWGVINQDVNPSISTLNTLSQFIGYENWRAFKHSQPLKKGSPTYSHLPKKSLYVTAGFVAAIVIIFLISNKRPENPVNYDQITFSSRPVTNSYPNSVVFDFDLTGVTSDSIHIQQYWDPTKTITIDQDQKQATGIYYFPGYFRAQLLVDGQSVREHDLFLKSSGWLGTIEYKPVPKYFIPGLNDGLSLTYPQHLEVEVKKSNEPLQTVYHYVNDMGSVSADNLHVTATIRVSYNEKWAVCQAARIYILGTSGAIIVPFSKIGCSSNNSLMLNDVYLRGKEHDLSAFGTDLSEFTEVEIQVIDQNVKIGVAGKEVFSASYEKSMGRLVGLRFKFLGLGEVQSYQVENADGVQIPLQ